MTGKTYFTHSESDEQSYRRKTIDLLLKVGAFFIILEPIWMLLPFAGFLYGSVMHIQLLSRNPYTSWLVHFVLPTHTLFPLGLILMGVGCCVFAVGAFQIYSAQLLKKGLVTTGIYGKFRHPQYLALTLFGLGILLTWGRFITYIAFFIMMWLYYFLSKSEERKCRSLFGRRYDAYRRKTWFLFPGEIALFSILRRVFNNNLPAWFNAVASFLLVVGLAIGSGLVIQALKHQLHTPPTIRGSLELSNDGVHKANLVMVKGPVMQAAPNDAVRQAYMDMAFQMLTSSAKIKQALNRLGLEDSHTILAFLIPGSNWHTGAHHDHRTAKINVFMIVMASTSDAADADTKNIFIKNHDFQFLKTINAQSLSCGRLEDGQDPTEGRVTVGGPPMGAADAGFQRRIQERIDFFTSGI